MTGLSNDLCTLFADIFIIKPIQGGWGGGGGDKNLIIFFLAFYAISNIFKIPKIWEGGVVRNKTVESWTT